MFIRQTTVKMAECVYTNDQQLSEKLWYLKEQLSRDGDHWKYTVLMGDSSDTQPVTLEQ